MGNKVEFGLEQVHIAFLDDSKTTPTWDEPIAIPGAVRFAPTPEGRENKFYADNGVYYSEVTNEGYTAELEMALFPDDVLVKMLGWIIDDNKMLVEVADGKAKEFALIAQVEGDKKARRFVYYKCKAARPSKESKTKGEGVEIDPEVMSLVIAPIIVKIDGEDRRIVKGTIEKTDLNTAVFDKFFDDVTMPNAVPSALNKTALAATIAIAETFDSNDWTSDSWESLDGALTAASTALSEATTQKAINSATITLQDAILALVAD